MINRTILQIPLSKDLKKAAEAQAQQEGFSSLQELVRVMLKKVVDNQITFSMTPVYDDPPLSKRAEKRYGKMIEDMKQGKNTFKADSIEDLLAQLHG